ncbi:unnamed protein product [Ilex paraguariensis]|uniref:Mediator complex subunit 15 KIX domain-containing protein n=1 Tax=Ilex paraguariensis TaxID=185542 RepID=A0ABC8RLR7_9AQUA
MAMNAGDWRSQLQPDTRQRTVNKLMETLKRHLPFPEQEGLQELKKIAVRFEEKIILLPQARFAFTLSDYLRTISLKMLTMETKSHNRMGNSLQSNYASNCEITPVPDSNIGDSSLTTLTAATNKATDDDGLGLDLNLKL